MNYTIFRHKSVLFFWLFLCQLLIGQSELISKTKLYDINGTKYISAIEYAKTQNIRTIFYDDKEKLEFRFQNVKLVLSPHSSFIRVNDETYHMYLPVIYDGNDFYIPITPFLDILNKSGLPIALVDSSEKFVLTTAPLYNVNSLSVANKVNGTIIEIHTSKQFTKDVLAASITRGGWLNLTIAGALVDSINLVESKMQKPVVRVRTIQSVESAQISFLLKSKVDADLEKVSIEMAYYPHVQGDESLREFTANKLYGDRGIKTDKDSIVLCNGSGEANGLIIQALINPGDYVITEQYVYMGTTRQLAYYDANIVGSPIDEQGLIPNKLVIFCKIITHFYIFIYVNLYFFIM